MLFRRIDRHVRDQNWFAVGVDFCIVVVGVFIGIQLGNWNAEQQNLSADRVYLGRIADDIQSDADRLQQSIENWAFEIEKAPQLEQFFLGEIVPGETLWESLVNAYFSAGWSPFVLDTTTYDELVASGRFSRIGDHGLRDAIIGYYNMLRESGPFYQFSPDLREQVRDAYDVKTATLLWTACFSEENYRTVRDGQVSCAEPQDGATIERIAEALRSDPLILEQLRFTHSIRLVAYTTAQEDLKRANALAARLREFKP